MFRKCALIFGFLLSFTGILLSDYLEDPASRNFTRSSIHFSPRRFGGVVVAGNISADADSLNFTEFTKEAFDFDILIDTSQPGFSAWHPLTPYYYYQNGNHAEGPRKWYVIHQKSGPVVKAYLPARAIITKPALQNIATANTATVNNEVVYLDTGFSIILSSTVTAGYGHLALRKAIKDDVDSGQDDYKIYEAGTHLGYVYTDYGSEHIIDFYVEDLRHDSGLLPDPNFTWNNRVNPLDYFSGEIKAKILRLEEPVYAYHKANGTEPFEDIGVSSSNINIDGTIWGFWFRDNPDQDENLNAAVQMPFDIITLMKKDQLNAETLWKTYSDNPGMSGLLNEATHAGNGAQGKTLYTHADAPFGMSKFFILSGNEQEGIAKIQDYENSSDIIYLKYRLLPNGTGAFDDKFIAEGFSSLGQAQADFSQNAVLFRKTVYKTGRISGKVTEGDNTTPVVKAKVTLSPANYGSSFEEPRFWSKQIVTETDDAGNYLFTARSSVPYTLEASSGSAGGFYMQRISGSVIASPDKNLTLNFSLSGEKNPEISIDSYNMDFGEVVIGNSKVRSFTITNTGGKTLTGTILHDRDWITTTPLADFSGNNVRVDVSVRTSGLPKGEYSGTITVKSNGGADKTIQVKVMPTCVITGPNPFIPGRGRKLKFKGSGVPYGTVRIYSFSGEIVKELKELDGKSEILWDGIQDNRRLVESGIYFYTASNPEEPSGNSGFFTVKK